MPSQRCRSRERAVLPAYGYPKNVPRASPVCQCTRVYRRYDDTLVSLLYYPARR
eukprot:COSAG02_NODE_22497_length_750_cov_1.284178_1_plen_53_part_01